MKFKTKLLCIATLSACALGGAQAADSQMKNQYNAAVSQADADYKTATASCKGLDGNDRDVCLQQAKATRDKAKADARATLKSGTAMADARDDRNDADYKVAKEKCDALSGDAKDACISNAKVKYHQ